MNLTPSDARLLKSWHIATDGDTVRDEPRENDRIWKARAQKAYRERDAATLALSRTQDLTAGLYADNERLRRKIDGAFWLPLMVGFACLIVGWLAGYFMGGGR